MIVVPLGITLSVDVGLRSDNGIMRGCLEFDEDTHDLTLYGARGDRIEGTVEWGVTDDDDLSDDQEFLSDEEFGMRGLTLDDEALADIRDIF